MILMVTDFIFSKIVKHLKVTKSANKAVIEDAVDKKNTSVTLTGRTQCDEDDYGWDVSLPCFVLTFSFVVTSPRPVRDCTRDSCQSTRLTQMIQWPSSASLGKREKSRICRASRTESRAL